MEKLSRTGAERIVSLAKLLAGGKVFAFGSNALEVIGVVLVAEAP